MFVLLCPFFCLLFNWWLHRLESWLYFFSGHFYLAHDLVSLLAICLLKFGLCFLSIFTLFVLSLVYGLLPVNVFGYIFFACLVSFVGSESILTLIPYDFWSWWSDPSDLNIVGLFERKWLVLASCVHLIS